MWKIITQKAVGAFSSLMGRETILKSRVSYRKTTGVGINLFAVLFIVAFTFSSCANYYYFGLEKVEVPKNTKIQYGDTKIVNVEEDGKSKYQYEDDFIEIVWSVDSKQFYFELKNKSEYSIKLLWDEFAYVNEKGYVMRLMHSGMKYTDRNMFQPISIVPKNTSISDILLPTDNVVYYDNKWRTSSIFPIYTNLKRAQNSGFIGKSVRIVFPIIIENITNEYIFEFNIDSVNRHRTILRITK